VGTRPTSRVALMAIHPEYADAILAGHKRVEFRKRPIAADVETVIIYATAPVKAIVGEFTVEDIVIAPPAQVWSSMGRVGAIDRGAFDAYYAGSSTAAAICVKTARRYPAEVTLSAIEPQPAVPQSFSYMSCDLLAQVHLRADQRRPLLNRIVSAVGQLAAIGHYRATSLLASSPSTTSGASH
jgi:predicted transcriptional regulator